MRLSFAYDIPVLLRQYSMYVSHALLAALIDAAKTDFSVFPVIAAFP
tara:strand:+ start:658 stop:798 length:141 start_codon:yes stop_codon:yes gene_type:complete